MISLSERQRNLLVKKLAACIASDRQYVLEFFTTELEYLHQQPGPPPDELFIRALELALDAEQSDWHDADGIIPKPRPEMTAEQVHDIWERTRKCLTEPLKLPVDREQRLEQAMDRRYPQRIAVRAQLAATLGRDGDAWYEAWECPSSEFLRQRAA
jgi:hypothetical protein